MKRQHSLLLILLFVMLAIGCTHQPDSRLRKAEAIMDVYPDSMLTMIRAIKPDSLPTEFDKAYYAILLNWGYIVNFRDTEDDSLIHIALDYFRGNGPDTLLMQSLYLSGHADDLHYRGLSSLRKSEEGFRIAEKMGNPYWMGKFCLSIATGFEHSYNPVDALDFANRAAMYFKQAGRTRNYYDAVRTIILCYNWLGNYNRSKELTDSLLSLDDVKTNSRLWLNFMNSRFYRQAYTKDYEGARITADSIMKHIGEEELSSYQLHYMALIAGNEKKFDEMERLLELGAERTRFSADTLALLDAWLVYYRKTNNPVKLAETYDSCLGVQNRVVLNSLKQSGVTEQRNMARIDLLETEKRHTREMTLLGAVLGVLAAGALMMWMYLTHRMRMGRMELEDKMNTLFELKDKYEKTLLQLDEAKALADKCAEGRDNTAKAFRTAMHSRFETMRRLCGSYLTADDKPDKSVVTSLLKDVRKEFERLSKPEYIAELEQMLDMGCGGLMKRFRADFGNQLSVKDMNLAVCMFSDISVAVTVHITGESRSQVYRHRGEIIQKVQASDVSDKGLYLRYLLQDMN